MMTIFICAKNNMITLSPNRQVKRRWEDWKLLFDNYENKYLVEIIFAVRDLWGKIWTYAVKWWNLIGFIMFESSHGFAIVWPRNWYAMRCMIVSFRWCRCVCSALTLQIFSTFCVHQIEKFRIKFLWYKTKANSNPAIFAKRSNVLATWAAQGTLTQLFSQMCKYVKDTLRPQFVYPCMVSHAGRIL